MAFPGIGFPYSGSPFVATGIGNQLANDLLTGISYVLVEPVVNTTLGTAVSAPGVHTVTPPSMTGIYPGAQLMVRNSFSLITVTATTATTFTANFASSFLSTDILFGATFPVGQTSAPAGDVNNPFFTQAEMLQYLSDVENDYLTACPMIMNVATQSFAPTQRTAATPSDAVQIEVVSVNGAALYEQGQASLDNLNYNWTTTGNQMPQTWYEDRLNFMTWGVQPVPGNAFNAQVLYAQRDSQLHALNEGFMLPDVFLHFIKYGVLMQCFGKDGEMRDPARARYCQQRYQLGIEIGKKFYANVQAQEVLSGNAA